jgi:hypothetical protein
MRLPILIAALAQLLSPASKPGHATIVASPASVNGTAGAKLSLFVDVTPKTNIHVYAPGTEFYIPITVKLNAQPEIKPGKIGYPKSETLTLLNEKVPVFQKPFRLTQEVTLDKSAKPGATVTVSGTVNYQACDDAVCYPPESAPVTWTVLVK